MRTGTIFAVMALLGLLAACTNFQPGQSNLPAPIGIQPEVLPAENENTSWPGFPPRSDDVPVAKRISADSFQLTGDAFADDDGGADNYIPPGTDDFVIIPGGDDDLAWAVYTFSGLSSAINGRPTDSVMAIIPGGDDDLPLAEFWIGTTDYTTYSWSWAGPFNEAADIAIPLNGVGDADHNRYVNWAGDMSIVVVADASNVEPTAGNPEGKAELGIRTSTANISDTWVTNKPHYPHVQATIPVGAAPSSVSRAGAKAASALDPSQYSLVTWQHIPAFSPDDAADEAFLYQVFRRGPDDLTPVLIGPRLAPFEEYTDPVNNAEAPEPIPGITYYYSVRAVNDAGKTPLGEASAITIPMMPPASIRAELNVAGDAFDIEWSPADGAESYSLYITIGELAPSLVTTGITATTSQDSTLAPGELGYYSVVAHGADANSPQSNGARAYMPPAVSTIDLGAGYLLDFVTVPAGQLQLGSPDTEWSRNIENETPYQSLAMAEYFISRTEISNEMYGKFMDAGGYSETYFEASFWGWFQANGVTEPPYWTSGEHNSGPGFPNYPVVGLSWAEANAFCNWATTLTALGEVRLPSEAEWEYSAEGPTAVGEIWLFPWPEFGPLPDGIFNDGNDGADLAKANSSVDLAPDTWSDTCEVTLFPLGRSWCGALNMAGNVWEWTDDDWRSEYPDPYIPAPYEQDQLSVVIRGGSYIEANVAQLRTSARDGYLPSGCQDVDPPPGPPPFFPVGFRCVIIPPPV